MLNNCCVVNCCSINSRSYSKKKPLLLNGKLPRIIGVIGNQGNH